MIERLGKETEKKYRRSLYYDGAFLLYFDLLCALKNENFTDLTPAEIFHNANKLVQDILPFGDNDDALRCETEDFAEDINEDECFLVFMEATAILSAARYKASNTENIIKVLMDKCIDHRLFMRMVDAGCAKEEKQWREGKMWNVIDYEFKNIIQEKNSNVDASVVIDELTDAFKNSNPEIQGVLLSFLCQFNNRHGNQFNDRINRFCENNMSLSIAQKAMIAERSDKPDEVPDIVNEVFVQPMLLKEFLKGIISEYFDKKPKSLSLIFRVLDGYGFLKKSDAYKAFVQALVEWGMIDMTEKEIKSLYEQLGAYFRATKRRGKIIQPKSFNFKEWDDSADKRIIVSIADVFESAGGIFRYKYKH